MTAIPIPPDPCTKRRCTNSKAPGERVADRREGSGSLEYLRTGALLLHGEPRENDCRSQCNSRGSKCLLRKPSLEIVSLDVKNLEVSNFRSKNVPLS